jgi:hypothetical protein
MLPILEQRWGALTFLSEALFLKEMRTDASAGLVTARVGTTACDGADKQARVRMIGNCNRMLEAVQDQRIGPNTGKSTDNR